MTLRAIRASAAADVAEPDWMTPFLASLAREDLAPATLRGYRYDLRHFLAWRAAIAGEAFAIGRLAAHDLVVYRQHMIAAGHRPATVNRRLEAFLEALAATLRDPTSQGYPALYRGNGGETTPRFDPDMPARKGRIAQEVQGHTAALAADATLARLKLAEDASGLALALETAQDPKALEKLLAHEIAAAHVVAMKLFTEADNDMITHRTNRRINPDAREPVRNALAGARVLDAVARGALALDRLRNGSRQTIVVVKDGGQAVVAAGNITTGGS